MTNRIIIVLLMLTVLMQAALLLKDRGTPPDVVAPPVVRAVPDAESAVIDLTGMPIEGEGDTKVVLVEFSDYECPFCQRHATTVRKNIVAKYVDTGQIRYAFANNPLQIHGSALLMATAAICAGFQHEYWEMHDLLFEGQATSKTRPAVLALADRLSLDVTAFGTCLEDSTVAERIENDAAKARELGLMGTPSFAIGRAGQSGSLEVQTLITGAQPFETFESALSPLLSAGESESVP